MTDRPDGLEDLTITIADIRRAGHCVRGVKDWFEARGFSRDEFRAFLAGGISAAEFWDRGDGLSHRVVLWKLGRP